MSSYKVNTDFLLEPDGNSNSRTNYLPSCCVSNICSCILFPFKVCMGLTWIGSCGLFFYLGDLYGQGQISNITLHKD